MKSLSPLHPAPSSLPLAQLLHHAADVVQAVRAGRAPTGALEECPAAARPGAQALSFHALRQLGCAQALRAQLAPKTPAPPVDALLLVALALLLPGEDARYTEHTLVDQAVAAAHQRPGRSGPFVNAVLRRFLREREALMALVLQDPVARFNHPLWWIERLKKDWPNDWQAMLEANNQHPPMVLRVNARRTTAALYAKRLAAAGLAATATGSHTVVLTQACAVADLPGFLEGEVSVQDVAAQRAAPLLLGTGLPSGAKVLDACAAPGGKTAHLLELADLDVLALDTDAQRLSRVHDTLARLRLKAQTKVANALHKRSWWDGQAFDAVLLDAPCSASGIVRRHPDVRWLRRASDVNALARTQTQLLKALWPALKPGGRLLYCTCSVFQAEGQAQIEAFLQRHTDAQRAPDSPQPAHAPTHAHNPLLAAPSNQDPLGDGFFYALIEKM
jgi:16S rRNA (cytosine967-C5)-methyltransferase